MEQAAISLPKNISMPATHRLVKYNKQTYVLAEEYRDKNNNHVCVVRKSGETSGAFTVQRKHVARVYHV